MIQANQRNTIELWEVGSGTMVTVAHVSIYSSPNNTVIIEVYIDGCESSGLQAFPGQTLSFVGKGIRSIHLMTNSSSV
ncbi:hypothetical protein J2T13_002231 [Paenibacillus sp. DS2015]